MTQVLSTSRRHMLRVTLLCAILALFLLPVHAQESDEFNPVVARAELEGITAQLGAEEIEPEVLTAARAAAVAIDTAAEECRVAATQERERLDVLFEPLQDVGGDVEPTVMDERRDILARRDEAVARQTQCTNVKDIAASLIERITAKQNQLSQQFLTNRVDSIIGIAMQMPERIRTWPDRIRSNVELDLAEGVTAVALLWLLILAGAIAAAIGILIRHRFNQWFAAAGGGDASPQLKYLFPRPLAQYSPLMLEGLALVSVLMLAIQGASFDLVVVRIAAAFFLYGIGCVIIDWATGPLSPAASVRGLIPDHVRPLRFRLRFFVLAIVTSFVILGTEWLAIRKIDPDVAGRATMIFLVAVSLGYVLLYLGRIPGIQGRFRLIRLVGGLVLLIGIGALLIGFQNLAGYLIHGVTRTALALFILWILLWSVVTAFEYLMVEDTPAATQLRTNLGVSERASRTGLGFMQLVADLVLWLGLVVYLIYVWDESGTTLDRLIDLVVLGTTVGNIQLVPLNIIGGILVFIAFMIIIGRVKRWIDRRWLQHIVLERGAREALITLFGYVGFIIAALVSLRWAGFDLGGLAWASAALALGIGFGMQEIANNFVSGLILLFERPIRAGDFVTVGEVEGFVRSIRIRATEIETLDNQNVLVPNSELISGRVTNWVLRDTFGRLRVNVGVAYGSDIENVREILEAVAHEHPEVITDGRAPGPRALFIGFGDSSLDFELRVRINRIDRRFTVKSDLNFAIDQAFREAAITIPFPQRDLHLVSYADDQPQVVPEPVKEEPEEETTRTRVLQPPDSVTRSHTEEAEFSAAIDDVWAAITDVEVLKRWIATDGEFAAKIGGRFSLSLRDGTDVFGRIDVFMPPRRMRLVVALRPDEWLATGPTTVEFQLKEQDDKTLLTVTIAGIPATEDWEDDYRRSEIRWKNGLEELQGILNRK